ncbi:hypothetical protein Bpfe_006602, partial [Biomphalaria pfeifferi]
LIFTLCLVAAFIGIVILLVILIGTLEFISPSNQAFIIFFTGILPLVIKLVYYSGSNDRELFFDTEKFNEKTQCCNDQLQEDLNDHRDLSTEETTLLINDQHSIPTVYHAVM